jgi:hypothetical protein
MPVEALLMGVEVTVGLPEITSLSRMPTDYIRLLRRNPPNPHSQRTSSSCLRALWSGLPGGSRSMIAGGRRRTVLVFREWLDIPLSKRAYARGPHIASSLPIEPHSKRIG